jgi:hypothetical protein
VFQSPSLQIGAASKSLKLRRIRIEGASQADFVALASLPVVEDLRQDVTLCDVGEEAHVLARCDWCDAGRCLEHGPDLAVSVDVLDMRSLLLFERAISPALYFQAGAFLGFKSSRSSLHASKGPSPNLCLQVMAKSAFVLPWNPLSQLSPARYSSSMWMLAFTTMFGSQALEHLEVDS